MRDQTSGGSSRSERSDWPMVDDRDQLRSVRSRSEVDCFVSLPASRETYPRSTVAGKATVVVMKWRIGQLESKIELLLCTEFLVCVIFFLSLSPPYTISLAKCALALYNQRCRPCVEILVLRRTWYTRIKAMHYRYVSRVP
jgi:hypothetical protein